MVAAGSNHSIALTDEHNVYVCGYNHKGQLGVGDSKSKTVWTHVKGLAGKRVGKIYSGGCHSWAVLGMFKLI
jgi:alpha-tubulin suppressor-like RCC1 family protein